MFNGHSGCQVYTTYANGGLVIRKVSSNQEYNIRLEAQYSKQKAYSGVDLKTPAIFNSGYIDNLFFFDMEYIRGVQLSEYIQYIQIDECLEFLKYILSSLPKQYVYSQCNSTIFRQKIIDLEKKLPKNTIIEKALHILNTVNWNLIPQSQCHGDLTFENIIVYRGSLYLIDFLDSFYNSWMIDLAKLLQDIELRWSYRKDAIDNNTHIRLLIIRELFISEIRKLENGAELLDLLYKLLILNLLRIIPYTRNEADRIFVYTALEKIL